MILGATTSSQPQAGGRVWHPEPAVGFADDPAVRGRDALLDGAAVQARLGSLLGGDVEVGRRRRVKYRIGESLRVVYDVVVDGVPVVMSARTFADSQRAFAQTDALNVHGLPGAVHDHEAGAVWWVVPNDRRMRNLATLLDPPPSLRGRAGVGWSSSELVEYAPERSATVRITDHVGVVTGFAKAFHERDVAELAARYRAVAKVLSHADGVRSPAPVGVSREHSILVLEPLRGVRWIDLDGSELPAALGRFGAAVAAVHSLPEDFGRGEFQRLRVARVMNSARLVAAAVPRAAGAAQRAATSLGEPPPATDHVTLHGDVHANNVLFDGDVVNMFDFDQSGRGPSAADIGSLLASLVAAQVIDARPPRRDLADAFLAGYRTVRSLPSPDELRWYTAAALVAERCIRAVNRVYPDALAVLPELLDAAADIAVGRKAFDG